MRLDLPSEGPSGLRPLAIWWSMEQIWGKLTLYWAFCNKYLVTSFSEEMTDSQTGLVPGVHDQESLPGHLDSLTL